ncbi:hypothetical protein K504DRAFT_505910 [Pleomassaria siparia CBS 279.74]|uniref:Protein kinase domain-containing protein n=1 Tax=Pleomassaria siparia CBS 279.74 TaxID=1314801 RepID=A0A6G1JYE0_9PLEO|nr:hypothetical protein K504DRAFT_505910 [Pleomassaria siparia CBS 279.74]
MVRSHQTSDVYHKAALSAPRKREHPATLPRLLAYFHVEGDQGILTLSRGILIPIVQVHRCCFTSHGRIIGLAFEQYEIDLRDHMKLLPSKLIDVYDILNLVRDGMDDIHSLSLVHCDVFPRNTFLQGEKGTIPGCDCARKIGGELHSANKLGPIGHIGN